MKKSILLLSLAWLSYGCVATAVTASQPTPATVIIVPPGNEKIYLETEKIPPTQAKP